MYSLVRVKGGVVILVMLIGTVASCFGLCSSAPELSSVRVDEVTKLLTKTFQHINGDTVQRYDSAREMASLQQELPSHELVYGELSVPVLATILDAAGVANGDSFLDIGSGDGALALGAALLYPDHLRISRGLEIVPGLVERSRDHAQRLRSTLTVPVDFSLGDVHMASSIQGISDILMDSTIGVCFATTWSAGNVSEECTKSLRRRLLPRLSRSLAKMSLGSKIIVIDGRLDENDGYRWEGDLRVDCPDTAPISIAALYRRV